jgi:hypothetical protein
MDWSPETTALQQGAHANQSFSKIKEWIRYATSVHPNASTDKQRNESSRNRTNCKQHQEVDISVIQKLWRKELGKKQTVAFSFPCATSFQSRKTLVLDTRAYRQLKSGNAQFGISNLETQTLVQGDYADCWYPMFRVFLADRVQDVGHGVDGGKKGGKG